MGVPLDNITVKILDPETLEEREGGQDGEVRRDCVCVCVFVCVSMCVF